MSFSKTIVISILVWMEDDFESPEDLYNFEAIGNWRVVLQDNGKYEKVFVPGNDILRTIRMLLRFFLNDLCVLERSRKRMKIIEITL